MRNPMSNLPANEDGLPAEIDFSNGISGFHHIPAGAKVLTPLSIERNIFGSISLGKLHNEG